MHGRQIGSWLGRRQGDSGAVEEIPEVGQGGVGGVDWKGWGKRLVPMALLVGVVVGVGWWVRREGAYRRFMAEMREGKVDYVEFQPYPNLPFVRITDAKMVGQVAEWLRESQPDMRRFGPAVAADCQMRIVMSDGTVRRLKIGQTGPIKTGGTLTASVWYVPVEGDGWKRAGYSGSLSNIYLRLPASAQLDLKLIPAGMPVAMGPVVSTTPTTGPVDFTWIEIHAGVAQEMLARGQIGQARRVVARAMALDPKGQLNADLAGGPFAQRLNLEIAGTLRIRLPQLIRELESGLPENVGTLSKEKYWQLREKLLDATLMAEIGDRKLAELRQRLSNGRPAADAGKWHEMLRLERGIGEPVELRDLAWSPDGATLAGLTSNGQICVWDSISGQMLARTNATAGKRIFFSVDGKRIGAGEDEKKVAWLDALTLMRVMGSADVAKEVKGTLGAQLNGAETVNLVNADGKVMSKLVGHAAKVMVARISPDGDQLVTYGEDRVASVWGEGVARGIDELSPYERFVQVQALSGPSVFAADGMILTFGVGPAKAGKEKAGKFDVLRFDLPSAVMQIQPAGKTERHLVELADGSLVVIEPGKIIPCARPKGWSGRAAIGADGKEFAQGMADGTVKLVEVEGGKEVRMFVCSPPKARKWEAVMLSSDGGWLMACGEGFVALWHAKSGEQLFSSDKASAVGVAGGFTADGTRAVMIEKIGGISFIAGKVEQRGRGGRGIGPPGAHDLAISGDGGWMAAVGEAGLVEVYDGRLGNFTAQVAVKVRAKDRDALCFSADGRVLAIKGEDGFVRVIEMPGVRELRRMKVVPEIAGWMDMPMSFSGDGKYLIVGAMVWGERVENPNGETRNPNQ